MMSGNAPSPVPVPGRYLFPIRRRTVPLVDFEAGAAGLNDPTGGLSLKLWTARYFDGAVRVSAPDVAETVLFTRPNITSIGLSFDQNMRPFVAFSDDTGGHYWWYDSTLGAQVFSDLPAGSTNLCCSMDERRERLLSVSDIILAYNRDNNLYFRQQRDRFATEYLFASAVNSELTGIGKTTGLRMQFRSHPL